MRSVLHVHKIRSLALSIYVFMAHGTSFIRYVIYTYRAKLVQCHIPIWTQFINVIVTLERTSIYGIWYHINSQFKLLNFVILLHPEYISCLTTQSIGRLIGQSVSQSTDRSVSEPANQSGMYKICPRIFVSDLVNVLCITSL